MSDEINEGVAKRVKKFFLRNTKTGKQKISDLENRAMRRSTTKGWADGQRRINKAKFNEEFDAENFIEFLLDEGHSVEEIETFLDNDFEDLMIEMLDEAERMSAQSPPNLIQRGLDHVEGEFHSSGRKAKQHQKAIDILTQHVSKEHSPKSGQAYKLAMKNSTRLKPDGSFDGEKQHNLERLVTTNSIKKLGDYVSKNAKGKIKFEETEYDTTGLTEESLMEIKMKLKAGQKMTPKMFAQMKADVLAKQKEKAAKKAMPKVEPKEETIETDDNNRGARILKGQFPWGKVTPELAKTAIAKLKMIEKPHDRLKAMDHIWGNQKHFHTLISTGKLNVPDKEAAKEKPKVSLAKVRGVD